LKQQNVVQCHKGVTLRDNAHFGPTLSSLPPLPLPLSLWKDIGSEERGYELLENLLYRVFSKVSYPFKKKGVIY